MQKHKQAPISFSVPCIPDTGPYLTRTRQRAQTLVGNSPLFVKGFELRAYVSVFRVLGLGLGLTAWGFGFRARARGLGFSREILNALGIIGGWEGTW